MNNRPGRNVRKINRKSGWHGLSPQIVLIIGIVVWLVVMADIFWANRGSMKLTIFLMLLFTIGIFGFTFAYARPGKYGESIWYNGFWNTLFHRKPRRNERRQRRRRQQMQNYRR